MIAYGLTMDCKLKGMLWFAQKSYLADFNGYLPVVLRFLDPSLLPHLLLYTFLVSATLFFLIFQYSPLQSVARRFSLLHDVLVQEHSATSRLVLRISSRPNAYYLRRKPRDISRIS